MAGPSAVELAALRSRLEAVLDPYRDRLVPHTVYGIPTLGRPGAKAHDWFAFTRVATNHVAFHLLPVHTFPELQSSLSPALAKRLTGKAVFTFAVADDALIAELERFVALAFERYLAGG